MKNHVLVAAAIALATTAIGGCATETGPSPSPSPKPTTSTAEAATGVGTMTLAQNTDYDIVGSWTYGAKVVFFESHMSTAGISTVKLTIDGADFETTFDYFTHAATRDGHANTLFHEDVIALSKFETYLNNGGGKTGRVWERLFTTVSMHGAAPPGYTFMQRVSSPTIKAETEHREGNAVWDEGINYLCRGYYGNEISDQYDWVVAHHDSQGGEGTGNGVYPNIYHGAYFWWAETGCRVGDWTGAGSCEGRCGAGCPRAYNFYFTKDCLDHDMCLDYHPAASSTSWSGDCGYEFGDASDDWAGGLSSSYWWDCPGSVPSNCAEYGNECGANN
jgi:hypothetical protein